MIKTLVAASLMILSITAFAGRNKYQMTKKGLYSGRLEDGRACSLEVTKIKKKFFTRMVTSMEARFVSPILVKNFSLFCEDNFENGHWCEYKDFLVDTRAGWHVDSTPQILFFINGKANWCKDLVIN